MKLEYVLFGFGMVLCLAGIGYLGIYDTVYITAGERTEKIEPDEWLRQEKFGARGVAVNRGEKAFFRYEVDNRQFSSYAADIEVSVWHSQEKVRDLISRPMSIAAFDKGQVEWVLDTAELLPDELSPEQAYELSVIINRGQVERKIIVYINPRTYSSKPVPVPSR